MSDSTKARRKQTRSHLAALFADIPAHRRKAFMERAHSVLVKILEEADPTPTQYDDKGRIAIMGTNKRDRAAIARDAIASMKLLGEISRDATEQHIAVTKLLQAAFGPQQPTAPTIHIHYAPSADSDEPKPTDSSEPPAVSGAQGDSKG